jgi:hypothetical protein
MPSPPTVSVVMPVYNGARFVSAAIASVCQQTYSDFEFLVIDDGSTDATPVLLAEAGRRDSRIQIVSQSINRGVVAARNAGMQRAEGRFVAVMDSDDVALPDRLVRQVAYMEAHPDIAALGGAVQLIDENDVPGPTKAYPLEPALVAWSLLFFNSMAHSTLMLRRDCLKGGYPEGGAEDYALLMELSLRARLANLPEVLVRYRTWPGALTTRTWERQEQHANDIVQHAIAEITGRSVSFHQVHMLRGLARDLYPVRPSDLRETGELIATLAALYVERMTGLRADPAAIRRDAGIRLWLLAVLALRRSPALACSLAARSVGMSPFALLYFIGKSVGKLSGR